MIELVGILEHADPSQSVRVSNSHLALVLAVSRSTVGRLKRELEEAGWITRRQYKTRVRPFGLAHVWLTDKAIAALGLGAKAPVDNPAPGYPQPESKRRSPMVDALDTNPHSFSKRPPAPTGPGLDEESENPNSPQPLCPAELEVLRILQAEYGDDLQTLDTDWGLAGATQAPTPAVPPAQDIPAGVPEDLVVLAKCGISLGGIRRLMGIASGLGARLGDVVAVAARHIERAANAFAYVLKLLRSKKDWGALARDVQSSRHDPAAHRHEADRGEPAPLAPVERLIDAMKPGAIYSHTKRVLAWRCCSGIVYQAQLRDLALGVGQLGRQWLPLANPGELAQAWANGRIHEIDSQKILSTSRPSLPARAALHVMGSAETPVRFIAPERPLRERTSTATETAASTLAAGVSD